ncbi:MAG: aminotransferase class V-fold PLP-dependent enzyme [Crocinitomicaceae bacterium]
MKEHFLLNPDVTYLNHGSFGATPKPVFEAYQGFQRLLEAEPLQFITKTGVDLLETSKKALAKYVHCDPLDLVYTTNPSTALNIFIRSLGLKEGDEILSTDQEYGALDRTWNYYCKKWGSTYVRQPIPLPLESKEQFLTAFWKGLTKNTKVVFLSEITSATALIFPVKEICEKARELGLITIIDGAHVPAHIPLNITEMNPDVYAGACHKWMMAPKGSSFLYVKKELQPTVGPLIVSWGYEADKPSSSQFQDYHQYQGTRDFSAFLTSPTCLAFMKKHDWLSKTNGCKEVVRHYYPIIAKQLNSAPICKLSPEFLGQICSIPIQTKDPVGLKELLYEKYHIEIPVFEHTKSAIYLRLSFQPYNDEKEIEILLNALSAIQKTTNLLE